MFCFFTDSFKNRRSHNAPVPQIQKLIQLIQAHGMVAMGVRHHKQLITTLPLEFFVGHLVSIQTVHMVQSLCDVIWLSRKFICAQPTVTLNLHEPRISILALSTPQRYYFIYFMNRAQTQWWVHPSPLSIHNIILCTLYQFAGSSICMIQGHWDQILLDCTPS